MKKILLVAALFIASQSTFAQGLKFGIKAGVNFANQEFEAEGISIKFSSATSFHIFGLVDYSITPIISIQPGLGISGKGSKIEMEGASVKYDLMYLDIPVNLIAKFPVPAFGKFFIGAGPYAGIGISGKAKGDGIDEEDEDVNLFSEEGGYKNSDFGVNFLGGIELKKGLTLNANYGLGLSNISSVDELSVKNKVFSVSLGFLF